MTKQRMVPSPRAALSAALLGAALWLGSAEPASAQAPALPQGLGGSAPAAQAPTGAPALPPGLGGGDGGPALPPGLGDGSPQAPASAAAAADAPAEDAETGTHVRWGGFLEARGGRRLQTDPLESRATLAELRLQLELETDLRGVVLALKMDFLHDAQAETQAVDLESGQGWVDLREANAAFTLLGVDFKVGRQIVTWGTGDLLFINDLFPKDYRALLLGRDEEYLKAPSDALRASAYTGWVNLDVVYGPRFDADRYIDGSRLSYYDPASAGRAGRDTELKVRLPREAVEDDEWAVRLFHTVGSYELALYAYNGFWKSPAGADPATGAAIFPRLAVAGASVLGPLGPGLAKLEVGRYDSLDDPDGTDPFVRNGEDRALLGYEQELFANFTAGVQAYAERMADYDAYRAALPPGAVAPERTRRVWTLRLTWMTHGQDVRWSLFSFYSPTDEDAYHRPKVHWRVNDHWSVEGGANLFRGTHPETFFGQLDENSNAYAAARFSF